MPARPTGFLGSRSQVHPSGVWAICAFGQQVITDCSLSSHSARLAWCGQLQQDDSSQRAHVMAQMGRRESLNESNCNEEGKGTFPLMKSGAVRIRHSRVLWSFYPAGQKWLCHTSDVRQRFYGVPFDCFVGSTTH